MAPSDHAPEDPPHDILAAEQFGMPASDPALRRREVGWPEDPVDPVRPYDVLAADAFPMPAAPSRPARGPGGRWPGGRGRAVAGVGVAAVLGVVLGRRRSRR